MLNPPSFGDGVTVDPVDEDDESSGNAAKINRREPLSSLSPGVRLAIAGVGVILGAALVFLGLRSMEPEPPQDVPASAILPSGITTP